MKYKEDQAWINDWNTLHIKYVAEEVSGNKEFGYRNQKMIEYLEEIIPIATKEYTKGSPIMSDDQFNRLEAALKRLDPNNPLLEKVGSEI